MFKKAREWSGVVALVAIILFLIFGQGARSKAGSSGTRFPNGVSADATSPIAGEVRGTTFTLTGAGSVTGAFTVAGAITQGGGIRATSTTNTSETLLATDFDTENVIDYTANTGDTTVTLPASTTLTSFLPTAGQMRTVWVRNATTTAATDIIIVGGSGTLLKVASSTNQIGGGVGAQQINGDTDGGNHARLDFVRKANTDIEVLMTVFRDN